MSSSSSSTHSNSPSSSSTSSLPPVDEHVSRRGRKPAELSEEQMKKIAAEHENNTRRSTYGPEFLKGIAESGIGMGEEDGFKVVTGREAHEIYHDMLGEDERRMKPSDQLRNVEGARHHLSRPVVFAFTVPDAGKKLVQYYMTWRGKTGTHRLKGNHRQSKFLESEGFSDKWDSRFKNVTNKLENEYKRVSIIQAGDETSPTTPRPLAEEDTFSLLQPPLRPFLERPLSNDSVTSLPILNGIRNVPAGNRLQLRVANPDPSLTSSGPSSPRDTALFSAHGPTAAPFHSSPLAQEVGPTGDEAPNQRRTTDNPDDILIVLLDDDQEGHNKEKRSKKKRKETWHNIKPREVSKATSRAPSMRRSPWNSAITRSEGEVYAYRSDDENDYGPDHENDPPLGTVLTALGYRPPSHYAYSYSSYSPAASNISLGPPVPYPTAGYPSPYSYSAPSLPTMSPYSNHYTSPYLAPSPYLPTASPYVTYTSMPAPGPGITRTPSRASSLMSMGMSGGPTMPYPYATTYY